MDVSYDSGGSPTNESRSSVPSQSAPQHGVASRPVVWGGWAHGSCGSTLRIALHRPRDGYGSAARRGGAVVAVSIADTASRTCPTEIAIASSFVLPRRPRTRLLSYSAAPTADVTRAPGSISRGLKPSAHCGVYWPTTISPAHPNDASSQPHRLIQEAGSASKAANLLVRNGKHLGELRRTGAIALENRRQRTRRTTPSGTRAGRARDEVAPRRGVGVDHRWRAHTVAATRTAEAQSHRSRLRLWRASPRGARVPATTSRSRPHPAYRSYRHAMTATIVLALSAALGSAQTPAADPSEATPQAAFEELASGFLAFHLYFNPRSRLCCRRPRLRRSASGRRPSGDPCQRGSVSILARSPLRHRCFGARRRRRAGPGIDRICHQDRVALLGRGAGLATRPDVLPGYLVEGRCHPRRRHRRALSGQDGRVDVPLTSTGHAPRRREGQPREPRRPHSRRTLFGARSDCLCSWGRTYRRRSPTSRPARERRTSMGRSPRPVGQLERFQAFLREDLALRSSGDAQLGPDRLGWLLKYRDHVEASPDQLLQILDLEIAGVGNQVGRAPTTTPATGVGRLEARADEIISSARNHIFRNLFATIPSDTRPIVSTRPSIGAWDQGGVWGPGPLQAIRRSGDSLRVERRGSTWLRWRSSLVSSDVDLPGSLPCVDVRSSISDPGPKGPSTPDTG